MYEFEGLPKLIGVSKAAEVMGVCERTVYNMIQDGRIKAAKVGNSWRVNVESIKAALGLAS